MVASMLLVLADATPEAVVVNYEAGFRGAASHRGHGWAYDAGSGDWQRRTDRSWTEEQLDTALSDRREDILEWIATFDVAEYLLKSGVSEEQLRRLGRLLIG